MFHAERPGVLLAKANSLRSRHPTMKACSNTHQSCKQASLAAYTGAIELVPPTAEERTFQQQCQDVLSTNCTDTCHACTYY